jgi:hypothetical protein
MKILKGEYLKENFYEKIEVLVLNDVPEYIKGIALHKLSEDQKKELLEIQSAYEEKLQPFMTNFRQYKKERFTEEKI